MVDYQEKETKKLNRTKCMVFLLTPFTHITTPSYNSIELCTEGIRSELCPTVLNDN